MWRWCRWPLLALLSVSAVYAGYQLAYAGMMVLRGSIDGDVRLYFMMGKTILQGFTPWIDMYESKPVGMYLFAAASMLLSGDYHPMAALAFALEMLVPFAAAFAVWRSAHGLEHLRRAMLTAATFALSSLLMLYIMQRAAGMESEFFGTCFGAFYVCTLLWRGRYGWGMTVLRAVLLLLSFQMKEPLMLANAVAALLLARSIRDYARTLIVPALLAVALAALFLLVMGWLTAYVGTHLPIMIWYRPIPILVPLQAINIGALATNMSYLFPSSWFLAPAIVCAWACYPLSLHEEHDARSTVMTIAAMVLSGLVFWQGSIAAAYCYSLYDTNIISLLPMTGLRWVIWLALIGAWLALLWKLRPNILIPFLLPLTVAYAASYTAFKSGLSGNHFAALGPIYIAVICAWGGLLAKRWNAWAFVPVALLTVIACLQYRVLPAQENYWNQTIDAMRVSTDSIPLAAQWDTLLDACGQERYAGDGTSVMLFARHPIWGPLPSPGNFPNLPKDHWLFTTTTMHDQTSDIYLTATPDVPAYAGSQEELTPDAPDCAKPYLPIGNMTVWFRRS